MSGVAAVVALECGWIVTEVGRQPWIVYNVMRTEDAVTEASGDLGDVRRSSSRLYAVLGAALVIVAAGDGAALARGRRRADADVPYGPADAPAAVAAGAR